MPIDVILPVLNEVEALPSVLGAFPMGFQPLVVDNGSTDGSAELARALGARTISEPRRGFGAACFAGLAAAGSEFVCFMDCDGSLDPQELPLVTEPVQAGRLELCLGTRRTAPAAPGAWAWHARLANRAIAHRLRRRTGAVLTDLGPMRAARRQELLELNLLDRRFGWPLEMVLRASVRSWRIGEVPVTYRPRTGGRSKVSGSPAGSLRAARDMGALLAGL
jgi:glycosyltransferase involved in cell wall biosynthesis